MDLVLHRLALLSTDSIESVEGGFKGERSKSQSPFESVERIIASIDRIVNKPVRAATGINQEMKRARAGVR